MSSFFFSRWIRSLSTRRSASRPTAPRSRLSLESLEQRITPDTRTWTGAFNANWADFRNWQESIVPRNGDDLVFPQLGQVTSPPTPVFSVNNIVDGDPNLPGNQTLSPKSITISGSGYRFSGNEIILGESSCLLHSRALWWPWGTLGLGTGLVVSVLMNPRYQDAIQKCGSC